MKNLYKFLAALGFVLFIFVIAIAHPKTTPDVVISKGTTTISGITVTPPPFTKTPSPTLTPSSEKPLSPCTFPLSETVTADEGGSDLQRYVFSAPHVVLTHASAIEIAGWLPDSQQLLITKEIPGTNRQAIEIFDTRTRREVVYAESASLIGPPAWLASQESVVFIDHAMEEGDVLRLSHKPGAPINTLQTHLASSYLAVDPAGEKVAFLLQGQEARPAVMDSLGQDIRLYTVELPLSSMRTGESIYHAAWRPRGNEVVFYNDSGLYLLDTVSGKACQIALGLAEFGERGLRWAYLAKWSPNGRYLAMITTSGRFPLEFSELTILDTMTGNLRTIQPERRLLSGKHYILDIDWAPDSTAIAARVAIAMKEGVIYDALYVISPRSAQQIRQLPEQTFTGASAGLSLAWSPDGKYLALNCPTRDEGRLCRIDVTKQGEGPR